MPATYGARHDDRARPAACRAPGEEPFIRRRVHPSWLIRLTSDIEERTRCPMWFLVKMVVFWVVVIVAIRLLVIFPNNILSRIAFSRHGPVQLPGESRSHYLLRQSRYALGWLAQAAFLLACGWYAAQQFPELTDETWFLALFAVTLPVLGAIALIGALVAALGAVGARLYGPERHAVRAGLAQRTETVRREGRKHGLSDVSQ